MSNQNQSLAPRDQNQSLAPRDQNQCLPHHRLVAYQVAVELLVAVKGAGIRDAGLREQALRAAKSACLNVAEPAGRASRADKARVFVIARGEAVEACAAVEIASLVGDASAGAAARCVGLAGRLVALLSGLARP
jgi:four helix bundle protein